MRRLLAWLAALTAAAVLPVGAMAAGAALMVLALDRWRP